MIPNNSCDLEDSINSENWNEINYEFLDEYHRREADDFLETIICTFKMVIDDEKEISDNFRSYSKNITDYNTSNGVLSFTITIPETLTGKIEKDINSEMCDGVFAFDYEFYEDENVNTFALGIFTEYEIMS
jgi:hypothetical protein